MVGDYIEMRTQYFYITGKSFHDERAFRVMGDIEYGLSTQLATPLPFWENRRLNDAALRIKFHDGAIPQRSANMLPCRNLDSRLLL